MATWSGSVLPAGGMREGETPFGMSGADPVIANFDPPNGSVIGRHQTLAFDVTDDSGLFAAIFVTVLFPQSGLHEVAWDGDKFATAYAGSSRSSISNGFHFVLQRSGGWPQAPTVRVTAVDTGGGT